MPTLTIAQVAERLNIHPQTARGLLKTGRINGFKVTKGSRSPWRVDPKALDAYIKSQTAEEQKRIER